MEVLNLFLYIYWYTDCGDSYFLYIYLLAYTLPPSPLPLPPPFIQPKGDKKIKFDCRRCLTLIQYHFCKLWNYVQLFSTNLLPYCLSKYDCWGAYNNSYYFQKIIILKQYFSLVTLSLKATSKIQKRNFVRHWMSYC